MDTADGPVDPFLAACQGKPAPRTPVWFMRQAGRSLPEYRAARGEGSMLETLRNPAVAAELTLQPVRRYHVDAAILYSDIMVPLAATEFGVEVKPGIGPVVAHPFRSTADLDRLRPFQPDRDAPWVAETVRILVADSPVPVIGFAGGPFTLASYLVEGGPSRDHIRTKTLMYAEPRLWTSLMERLAATTVA
jgi:uroporphyrinogen decarboxylase